MEKKYIFITGVSSGIGYGLTRSLIEKGYHIIGTVRNEVDAARVKADFGADCSILIFDVRDAENAKQEIDSVIKKLDLTKLYALINNAGIASPGPMQYLSDEDFEQVLDINVKAVRRITNQFLPLLGVRANSQADAGRIINISSVSGMFNSPYNGAYCISKHALESLTDIYRRELSEFGIKVISILPGPIKTEIWRKNLNSMDKYMDTIYGETLQYADKLIQNAENSALDVSVVVNVIIKALKDTKPKTRYIIHRKKFLFKMLATLVPDKWADLLIKRTMANKENYRPI